MTASGPDGAVLFFTRPEMAAWIKGVKHHEFDDLTPSVCFLAVFIEHGVKDDPDPRFEQARWESMYGTSR